MLTFYFYFEKSLVTNIGLGIHLRLSSIPRDTIHSGGIQRRAMYKTQKKNCWKHKLTHQALHWLEWLLLTSSYSMNYTNVPNLSMRTSHLFVSLLIITFGHNTK